MIEKVNPCHPDKRADVLAGVIVDMAYEKNENAICAVEVLAGHGECNVIIESSENFTEEEVQVAVDKIFGEGVHLNLKSVPQDSHLSENQSAEVRCGDNGIFRGVPLSFEEEEISRVSRELYSNFPYDGKYILSKNNLIVCQSNATEENIRKVCSNLGYPNATINPIGEWTGGIDVDSGATNRKLGSDMAKSVTGGGPNGKDLSKADVSANIWAFVKAQETGKVVELYCAIGDTEVKGKIGRRKVTVPYKEIVDFARDFIEGLGGFGCFSEWGLY